MAQRFGGFGGLGNMQQMMKQAQKMQQDLKKAQDELNQTEFTGTSGGNMVEVVLTGDKKITSIHIDPQVVDPEDTEMLEDLITAAFADALERIDEKSQQLLGPMAGMLGGM